VSGRRQSWTRSARRGKAQHSGIAHREGIPRHVHFVVQPVTEEQRRSLGAGPRVQVAMFDAGIMPPEDEVREFADQARDSFG
jgi:hypothetical protein